MKIFYILILIMLSTVTSCSLFCDSDFRPTIDESLVYSGSDLQIESFIAGGEIHTYDFDYVVDIDLGTLTQYFSQMGLVCQPARNGNGNYICEPTQKERTELTYRIFVEPISEASSRYKIEYSWKNCNYFSE